ncbi:mitochondrial cytochrome c-type biogenesis protein CcmD [Andalucia godoyi]|uniref:Mitochondrial cytochrome c-type biogenesis protein CcmD n=1 Tax=Andalucia godoyi TaxID=505711 RepID=A0A8K0AHT5_ANDGO|nr:mitochondrial cytochrome c-type biogenesis protein CcmD [Andalucia godoyi]|eukprot:ANDGO_06663.mRNA.1 mitochondrial cytochrome c-type biogenesis protein CcmD
MPTDWSSVLEKTRNDLVALRHKVPKSVPEWQEFCTSRMAAARTHMEDYPMVWLSYGIGAVGLTALVVGARLSLASAERALRRQRTDGVVQNVASSSRRSRPKVSFEQELARERAQFPDLSLPGSKVNTDAANDSATTPSRAAANFTSSRNL